MSESISTGGSLPGGHRPPADDHPWRLGFWSLIVTQFQGAFSDNVLKNIVILVVVSLDISKHDRYLAGELVGALFAIPFILFSLAGGFLADRFSKRTVTIWVKVAEVGVMAFALAGFAWNHLPMQLAAVFLTGVQSALFGPSKYGILPEMLPEKRLSWGNGVLIMGTNVAILTGTVVGAWLAEVFRGRQVWSGWILIALALIGLCASLGISRVPPADVHKRFRVNPFADFWTQLRIIRRDRVLLLAVLGGTYFAFLGALALLNIVFYGTEVLGLKGRESFIGYLMAVTAIGIGVGSLAAGWLSGRKIEYGLVPLGAMGLTVFGLLLARPTPFLGPHLNRLIEWVFGAAPDPLFTGTAIKLALLGFSGGFYIVPLSALTQYRPNPAEKGGVLAATNMLSFIGVALASLAHYVLAHRLDLSPTGVFFASALMTLAGTVYVVWLVPDSLLRLLLWMLTHTVYRIRVEGRDNIPEKGGALFVCNHVSFVDALLLIASTDRFLRGVMFQGIYDLPWIRPFAKILRAIPISSHQRPREMIRSLRTASEAIRAGEVVVIFAEGQITRIGQLLPFRRGFERIMRDVDAPIIPVCVDGAWGSIFSFERGRFLWKMPRYFPYPVAVCYGKPLPPTSTPVEVRQAVQDLIAEAWPHRRRRMETLDRAFLRKARHHPARPFLADSEGNRLRMGGALTRTVLLARRLKPLWQGQEMVGILLPPSIGGALVNYAALLLGKVPVNLNYTLSDEALASCARQCRLQTVVTSRPFLEKLRVTVPAQTVSIEELAGPPGWFETLTAALLAWTLPAPLLGHALGRRPTPSPLDATATVIFSSGSTGEPKGVMLSHYNIASNIEQLAQVFALSRRDVLLGILPFFHSFGTTVTLLLPAALGIGVVYHPNPLDAKAIGPLVRRHRVTFLLATPTFLNLYLRACEPAEFGSLDYVVTVGEKLPDRLAQAFEDRFGIRPLEGYGCTECSPVVTVNTHDFRAAGFRQVGAKRGRIGHPLPGVTVRIVDPDTGQPVPVGRPGLLLVRGPNVMQGYLGRPDKTAEVLRDGWYRTGDIATLDEDGFLTIGDRLSRFSKIGGEMVPHLRIEEALHELAGVTDPTFAVTSVPDPKKGERLVVLHTLPDGKLKECLDRLAVCGLPNLWKPRPDQFFRVEKLPRLGSGKLDLCKLREIATNLSPVA